MSARELAGRAAGLAEQRHAYYYVLHDDRKFVRDLRTLFKSLFPAFSKSLTPQQRLDAIRLSDAREATPKHNAKVKDLRATMESSSGLRVRSVVCSLHSARWRACGRPRVTSPRHSGPRRFERMSSLSSIIPPAIRKPKPSACPTATLSVGPPPTSGPVLAEGAR